ncbi:MAG TPA: peptidoglycan DD-metalloendopeptidase family protein [Candidatus Ozemobacteraceae bacterium]|nr:peptidoglycan DD-metalloendopeptidase family protein [Candidatus Ozemobacteraceae bacterium]
MVRNHVAPLLITCVVLICGLLPAHLHAEDPLATLQDHAITDSDSAAAAKGAGTGAAASGVTAEQMEKTISSLEALVKQYEALIKKLEGRTAVSRPAAGTKTGTVQVGTSLNVRSGPWGKIVGKLGNGNQVQIVAKEGDWFKIKHGNGYAYIHSYYVSAPGHKAHQGAEPTARASNRSSGVSISSSSGSKPPDSGSKPGTGGFGAAPCSPMPGRASSEFGPRNLFGHSFHSGIDLPVPTGTRLNSLGAGTVVACGYESGGGRFVKVKYDNGFTSFYCHLQSYNVSNGQRVSAGQQIARSDNTGQWTTGAHLHMTIYDRSGKSVNPRSVSGIKLPPK